MYFLYTWCTRECCHRLCRTAICRDSRVNHMFCNTFPMRDNRIIPYLIRVTDWEGSNDILHSLEKAIQSRFIPALTGQPPPGEHTREMLALPARLGGLGLMNPTASANEQRAASQQISAPLVDRLITQDHQLDGCHAVQQSIKRRIQHSKHMK